MIFIIANKAVTKLSPARIIVKLHFC